MNIYLDVLKRTQTHHDVTSVHYTNPDIYDLNNYEIINNEILFITTIEIGNQFMMKKEKK